MHKVGVITVTLLMVISGRELALLSLHDPRKQTSRRCRVGEDVATPTPHSPGRADFPLPVPFPRGSRRVAARWHAEWSVAKRRVPPRATARTLVPCGAEPIRREQPIASCAPHLW